MTESSVHMMLCALFHWHRTIEMGGLPPINILHRVMTEGNVTRSGRAGSSILCPDMAPELRKVQRAFNGLDVAQKIIIVTKHMPNPLNEDGTPRYKQWGDKEKAEYLGEPMRTFRKKYKDILREMKGKL